MRVNTWSYFDLYVESGSGYLSRLYPLISLRGINEKYTALPDIFLCSGILAVPRDETRLTDDKAIDEWCRLHLSEGGEDSG